MTQEDLIINTYCLVDDYLKEMKFTRLRTRGEPPAVCDAEVTTMEIVDEFLGHNTDKAIWVYFKEYWLHLFPNIGCRTRYNVRI